MTGGFRPSGTRSLDVDFPRVPVGSPVLRLRRPVPLRAPDKSRSTHLVGHTCKQWCRVSDFVSSSSSSVKVGERRGGTRSCSRVDLRGLYQRLDHRDVVPVVPVTSRDPLTDSPPKRGTLGKRGEGVAPGSLREYLLHEGRPDLCRDGRVVEIDVSSRRVPVDPPTLRTVRDETTKTSSCPQSGQVRLDGPNRYTSPN